MTKRNFVFPRGAGGWSKYRLLAGLGVLGMAIGVASADTPFPASTFVLGLDASGITDTLKVDGPFKTSGPFFQSLGSNGRSCATCHVSAALITGNAATSTSSRA